MTHPAITPAPAARLRQACTLLALGSLAALPLVGCKKPAEEPTNSQPVATAAPKPKLTAEDAQIIKRIAAERLEERLADAPSFDRAAELRTILKDEFGIDLDALFPDGVDRSALRDQEQIRTDIETRVAAEADVKFPAATRAQLVKEAEQKFPILKVGDRVTVSVRGGRQIEGAITEIGAESAKIGLQVVRYADVLEPNVVAFDKERSLVRREQYVTVTYDTPRADFIEKRRKELLPKELKRSGFVSTKGKIVRIDSLIDGLDARLTEMEKAFVAKQDADARAAIEQEMTAEGLHAIVAKAKGLSEVPASDSDTATAADDSAPAN